MAQTREHVQSALAKRRRTHSRIRLRAGGAKTAPAKKGDPHVTEIRLSKARYQLLAAKRRRLAKLLANVVDTLEVAEREGRVAMLQVSPDGESQIVATVADAKPIEAAIARAKARGQTKIADILKGRDMLTARDFGPLIGASHETVNLKRKRHEVLGLEGATRGVKYPNWQVTETGLPLPGLPRLFGVLGDQPWTVYRFLRTVHAELGGRTALDALKAGQVEAVVGVAENQAAGAFA